MILIAYISQCDVTTTWTNICHFMKTATVYVHVCISSILPLRKNLLGLKRKANNYYFAFSFNLDKVDPNAVYQNKNILFLPSTGKVMSLGFPSPIPSYHLMKEQRVLTFYTREITAN